jgi:predicted Zn-dependent protease
MTVILDQALDTLSEGGTLARALGLHPRILDLLVDKAIGLIRHGKAAEARGLLEDLARVDGESPVVPQVLGALHAREGRMEAAVEAYSDALSRAERIGFLDLGPLLLSRAHALYTLDRANEARADLEAVVAGCDEESAAEAQTILAAQTAQAGQSAQSAQTGGTR